ncbi:hypothetical protein MED222_05850 [Vibrio sp. MED222]|nr:hypothetical protein MED222_05850 [Vibrio sp. MED222]
MISTFSLVYMEVPAKVILVVLFTGKMVQIIDKSVLLALVLQPVAVILL